MCVCVCACQNSWTFLPKNESTGKLYFISGSMVYSMLYGVHIICNLHKMKHKTQAEIISQSKGSMTMLDLFGGSVVT